MNTSCQNAASTTSYKARDSTSGARDLWELLFMFSVLSSIGAAGLVGATGFRTCRAILS